MTRSFLSINDLNKKELEKLIDLAIKLKKEHKKGKDQTKLLQGKFLGMFFEKPSLRTRISFEAGMKQLGGQTIVLKNDEVGLGKREAVSDVAKVLSGYLDAIMVRTFAHEIVEELASEGSIPVINALTDEEHPCQILADLQTIKESFGSFKNLKLAYIGDGNNVAKSLMLACTKLEIQCEIACPQGYEPEDEYLSDYARVNHSVADAAQDATVLYTDVWASMGQEKEAQERKEVFASYQISEQLLKNHAHKDAIVLHCLPAHRGEEITNEVMTKHSKTIFEQAENRMHAQKALLYFLLK